MCFMFSNAKLCLFIIIEQLILKSCLWKVNNSEIVVLLVVGVVKNKCGKCLHAKIFVELL